MADSSDIGSVAIRVITGDKVAAMNTNIALLYKRGVISLSGVDLYYPEKPQTLIDAVLISLFTDARAQPQDLPDDAKRGWWGNNIEPRPIGSRLWTLQRRAITETLIPEVKQICTEALSWMVEDGIAKSLDVLVERVRLQAIGVEILITQSDNTSIRLSFDNLWSAIWQTA